MSNEEEISVPSKPKRGKSKWQDASYELTNIRVKFDDLLGKGFTDEEKKSERYKQLFESVELMFKHIDEYYNPNNAHSIQPKKKSKINWKLVIYTSAVAAVSVIAENFGGIMKGILHLFGVGH